MEGIPVGELETVQERKEEIGFFDLENRGLIEFTLKYLQD